MKYHLYRSKHGQGTAERSEGFGRPWVAVMIVIDAAIEYAEYSALTGLGGDQGGSVVNFDRYGRRAQRRVVGGHFVVAGAQLG